MKMLLLSTSDCIYWLARQVERMVCYEYLFEQATHGGKPRDPAGFYSGFYYYPCEAISGSDAAHLRENQIPKLGEQINQNVQQVRGIISQETFELFNLVKRLCDSGSYRAASFQVEACRAAMNFEADIVRLFWQMGVYSERIDLAYTCNKDSTEMTIKLNEIVQQLPANTRWRELMRPADRLAGSGDRRDFIAYQNMFSELVAQGI